jgi:hypothetical protein
VIGPVTPPRGPGLYIAMVRARRALAVVLVVLVVQVAAVPARSIGRPALTTPS